jgi:hypothetical protein
MSGFRLVVDDRSAMLEVALDEGVDASAWIAALPTEITGDGAFVAVGTQDTACGE